MVQQNGVALLDGVWAALLSPRTEDGAVDHAALAQLARQLELAGVRGLVLNGATGEYASASLGDIEASLATLRQAVSLPLILGVGAPDLEHSVRLASLGEAAQVTALLAPVPFFFPYQAQDAVAYVEALAQRSRLPILLYNLPQFTTGYAPEAVAELRRRCPQVVGMKDSSGSLDQLRRLHQEGSAFCRILGNDGALGQAIEEGILHALISGVAGVAPELILSVWNQKPGALALLAELLTHLDGVPTPWGLKWIAETRAWFPARYPMPLSEARRAQATAFQAWAGPWLQRTLQLESKLP